MAKRKTAPRKNKVVPGDTAVAMAEAPADSVYIGRSVKPEFIWLRLANRHGLITGATGTGKTVTLQGLAEAFSDQGVPVFCADVKGDLSGVAEKGEPKGWIEARAKEIGYTVDYKAYPVIFWDLFGEQGHPIRATVTRAWTVALVAADGFERGAGGRAQYRLQDRRRREAAAARPQGFAGAAGGLGGARRYADHQIRQYHQGFGRFDPALAARARAARCGAFLRRASAEHQGSDADGPRRARAISACSPRTSSWRRRACTPTFLLFLLSELFEELPEVGDPEKPKLVFFFDEAHLLFKDAPKALLEKVEQVVRLIRSKGVGVYFVTQNPLDIPDTVSRQLGNRIQHALARLHSAEQKAVKIGGADLPQESRRSTPSKRSCSSVSARRWSPHSTKRASPAWWS